MNNGQMDRGNENPTQHLPWWLRETMKTPSQVVWDRDFNSGPPKFKSSVLPVRHLSRWCSFCFVEQTDIITIMLKILLPVC